MAYIGQIFSRQRKPELGEQILYGADTDGMLPIVLHPDEWLDGALVPSYHNSLGARRPTSIKITRSSANFTGAIMRGSSTLWDSCNDGRG